MYCFSVVCPVCFTSLLPVYISCVTNAFDYFKTSIEPVAVYYEWITKNIKTPGNEIHYMIARVTITVKNGDCIYDKFIKPESHIIDYRTYITGITEDILKTYGEDIETVQSDVQEIISNKIVVGHCLHRLLKYLLLEHPIWNKRDTALYPPFHRYQDIKSLKTLVRILLNININVGINSAIEFAKAAMKIYLNFKVSWDKNVLSKAISLQCPIAIDCEMVAKAGEQGYNDMLARVSLTDINETCIYDKYVLPTHKVVDYRTRFSGIDESKLQDAVPLDLVKKEVEYITRGKVLIGHDLSKDTVLLDLHPPFALQRDTSLFSKFRLPNGRKPKLKYLAKNILNITIQNGPHCSIEDALACMKLYKLYKDEWDSEVYENYLKYVDQNDLTSSNPEYKSTIVALVCSLQKRNTYGHQLHRVSIIDSNLVCTYDKYISETSDGIGGPYKHVTNEVSLLLKNKIIVGFDLRKTFAVLSTTATFINRRDALLFEKFHTLHKNITLSEIFNQFLPKSVGNTSTENTVDIAKKLMVLYNKYKEEWDIFVQKEYMVQIDATYNSTLQRPLAISTLVVKVTNTKLLQRVSIVDVNNNCIFDKYIEKTNPESKGKYMNTKVYSTSMPNKTMSMDIQKIINNNIIIGYNLNDTLRSIGLSRPWWLLRDIKTFSRFEQLLTYRPELPLRKILQVTLQINLTGDNETFKTAKVLMQVYNKFKDEWNEEIKRKYISNVLNKNAQ